MENKNDIIARQVVARLTEKTGQTPHLEDSLVFAGVDSICMAELAVELENEFRIQIDDDITQVDTVGELIEYIQARTSSESSSQS